MALSGYLRYTGKKDWLRKTEKITNFALAFQEVYGLTNTQIHRVKLRNILTVKNEGSIK